MPLTMKTLCSAAGSKLNSIGLSAMMVRLCILPVSGAGALRMDAVR